MVFRKEKKRCGLLKLYIILIPLIVAFYLILNINDTYAVSITNGIYSTAIYTKNFETTKTVYNQGPLNIGSGALSAFNEVSPTGIWDYTQALSFPNPYSDKTGTGYVSSLYFTMHSTNGPFLNSQISYIMANSNLGFEGLSEDLPYCSQSYEVRVQDSSTVQFLLRSSCPYGSYPSGTTFNEVESLIDYSPESIFWCANDNPSQMCGSYMGVTVYNIDYYFGLITTQEDSYNQTIINQNQTIINQNQTFYDHEYQAENNISGQSTSDISNAENAQTTSIIGTISSFLTALQTVQTGSCELTLPFPQFIGGNQTVNPCSYKDKAPTIVSIGSSMFLIGVFIPFAFVVLKMIYNEIRSFTNG